MLGNFRDLVLATLTHPAMLQYLDNAQSAVGHVNENYARELLELHTMGVGSGYTQQDVQELARVLTGIGVTVTPEPPKLKPEWQGAVPAQRRLRVQPGPPRLRREDIARTAHRRGRLCGSRAGGGPDVAQPACARFVATRLATYFVADDPPPALVAKLSRVFQRTHGDLRAVVEALFTADELLKSAGGKIPRPDAVRDRQPAPGLPGPHSREPAAGHRWLNALGEAPFGRSTPDGYPLTGGAWTSSGQMSRRFEIARAIGSGNAGLFQSTGATPGAQPGGFPQLATRFYYELIEPRLGADTRAALERASSQAEWNTYLLASPELNYR